MKIMKFNEPSTILIERNCGDIFEVCLTIESVETNNYSGCFGGSHSMNYEVHSIEQLSDKAVRKIRKKQVRKIDPYSGLTDYSVVVDNGIQYLNYKGKRLPCQKKSVIVQNTEQSSGAEPFCEATITIQAVLKDTTDD